MIRAKRLLIFFIPIMIIFLIFSDHFKLILQEKIFNQKNLEISQLQNKLSSIQSSINKINSYELDLRLKESQKPLYFKYSEKVKFSEYELKIFKPEINILSSGINNRFPGSAYLENHGSKLILVSSIGIIAFAENIDDNLHFEQISNNVNDFLKIESLKKENWFSIKDVLIDKKYIYLSYSNEIKPDCWNTSIIRGKFNVNHIVFESFFSPEECASAEIALINGEDKHQFNAHQSGGRMIAYNKNYIIFSTGDYRNRFNSQKNDNHLGKIILINKQDSSYKIISKGHRNPQGLYLHQNKIISSEHGPQGGDEINLIDLRQDMILNYGWPISSYGEHYGGRIQENFDLYQIYELKKSHKEFGFIEPLKYFNPSIGPSEISYFHNKFFLGSMKAKSLYTFTLDKNQKIENFEKFYIGERIRDITLHKDRKKLLLFLEDSASIGVLGINE